MPTENKQNWKIPAELRRTETLLGISSILITFVYGAWGIFLTNRSNELNTRMLLLQSVQTQQGKEQIRLSNTQIDLSKQQISLSNEQIKLSQKQDSTSLDLQHFSLLLVKTDAILDDLKKQLHLTELQNKRIDENSELDEGVNLDRLSAANEKIQTIMQPYIRKNLFVELHKDSTALSALENILIEEKNNPVLYKNDSLYNNWQKTTGDVKYLSTTLYTFNQPDFYASMPYSRDSVDKMNQRFLFSNFMWLGDELSSLWGQCNWYMLSENTHYRKHMESLNKGYLREIDSTNKKTNYKYILRKK